MQRVLALFALPVLAVMLSFTPALKASSHTTTKAASGVPHTDSQIDATIRAKLAKSKIGKDGFRFKVQHGVVTWEGTTNVIQHKGSATRMARTAGATQVINIFKSAPAQKRKPLI